MKYTCPIDNSECSHQITHFKTEKIFDVRDLDREVDSKYIVRIDYPCEEECGQYGFMSMCNVYDLESSPSFPDSKYMITEKELPKYALSALKKLNKKPSVSRG